MPLPCSRRWSFLLRPHDGYDRLVVIPGAAYSLEAHPGRNAVRVVVADVDAEADFAAPSLRPMVRRSRNSTSENRPATSWQSTPSGTTTQRFHTARVRATG